MVHRLLELSEQLLGYRMKAQLTLTAGDQTMRFPASIQYTAPDLYSVVVLGPLGVRLAVFTIEGENFFLSMPQLGRTVSGSLDNEIVLPGLAFNFSSVRWLTLALSPYPKITPESEWRIEPASSLESGRLLLKSKRGDSSVDLGFSVEPFQVYRETWRTREKVVMERLYQYHSERDLFPTQIVIRIDENQCLMDIEDFKAQWRKDA